MALDFGDHFLQSPDGLLTALLWHFLAQVILRLLRDFPTTLFGVFRHIGRCLFAKTPSSSLRAGLTGLLIILAIASLISICSIGRIIGRLISVLLGERLLLVVGGLHLRLKVVLGKIWGIVPGVILSRLVELCKLILIWIYSVCGILSGITSHISDENSGIIEQLSELTIGDEQGSKCSQTFQCLVAMLLGSLLIGWGTGQLGITSTNMLRLPDEILEQIALVLGQKKNLGLLNDLFHIGDEIATFLRQLGGWLGKRSRREETVQRNIDLFVLAASISFLGITGNNTQG